jgi:hypothetical protein
MAQFSSPGNLRCGVKATRLPVLLLLFLASTVRVSAQTQTGPVRLRLVPADQLISPSSTLQFKAVKSFLDSAKKLTAEHDVTSQVLWLSSDPSIVAIDKHSGLATASTKTGTVHITARSGPFRVTVPLTVSTATLSSIAVNPVAPSIPLGLHAQFKAVGTYSDSTTHDLTSVVTWASSATNVASINALGFATTLQQGSSSISAGFGGVTGTTTFTVNPPALDAIALSPGYATIFFDGTQQFSSSGIYTDGSTKDFTSVATWSSSNPTIATIAAGGLATAVKQGSTTIQAVYQGISGQTIATVSTVVTSGLIGAAGGSVAVTNPKSSLLGARVDIPPGALSQDTLITIGIVPTPPQDPDLQHRGHIVDFGPSGLQFNLPVAITLPSVSTDLGANSELVYFYNGNAFEAFSSIPQAEGPTQSPNVTTKTVTALSYHFTEAENDISKSAESAVQNAIVTGFDSSLMENTDNCKKFCTPRNPIDINQIVLHSTHVCPLCPFPGVLANALRPPTKTERAHFAHYYVDRNGTVVQRLDDILRAPHVGTAGVNESAIGIEMYSNTDQEKSGTAFEPVQLDATVKLTAELLNRYRIPALEIWSHQYWAQLVDCNSAFIQDPEGYDGDCQAYKNDHADPYAGAHGFDMDNFISKFLTLTVEKSGSGSVACPGVEGIPDKVGLISDCSGSIVVPNAPGPSPFTAWSSICPGPGTKACVVTLNATADLGYTFVGWTDPTCSPYGTGSCQVTMDTNKTVTASFIPKTGPDVSIDQLSCSIVQTFPDGFHYSVVSASGRATGDVGGTLTFHTYPAPLVVQVQGFQSCGSWTLTVPVLGYCLRDNGQPAITSWSDTEGYYGGGTNYNPPKVGGTATACSGDQCIELTKYVQCP